MAYEELLLSPVGALTRYRDADARPLCGEAIVTDPEFRAQLELKRCPYAGTRKHHPLPMNVSALKQMTRHWSDVLGTARLLGHALGGATTAGPSATARLMRVAYGAMCLPLYLLYRATSPMRDGEVPGFVSGLHKASIDIATGAQLMLLLAHGGDISTGSLLELVEHEGLLIGAAGVCAGPPHMINELLDAMTGSHAAPSADRGLVERALGDLTGLVGYVDALLELTVARQIIGAYIRRRVDALVIRCASIAATDPGVRELNARLGDAAARHPVPTRPSEIIQRQDRVLREMPAAVYDALIAVVEHGRAVLTPSGADAAGAELLAHARRSAPPDRAEVSRVIQLAERPADDPWTTEIAEAIVDSARLEQLALAFYSSIEATIGRALGRSAPSTPLTSEQLARVFGTSPARYLGHLIEIDVAISDRQTVYSRRYEGSRRVHSLSN
jgi:hypothetical protein